MTSAIADTCLQAPFFKDGVITFLNEKGETCTNIFEVGVQAMAGRAVMEPYTAGSLTGLVPRYQDINRIDTRPDDEYARAAIDYLFRVAVEPTPGALAWEYDFDVIFRGRPVASAPWRSAFGQAYAVLAMVYWHRITGQSRYLEMAVKGARFFDLPIEDGGVSFFFKIGSSDGAREGVFFEEIPSERTHILNAHLISMISLMEVLKHSGDPVIKELLKKGVAALEEMLPKFDLGYWSRYDLPEKEKAFLRLGLEGVDEVFLSDVKLRIGKKEISRDLAQERIFDPGPFYISGLDWGEAVLISDRHARKALNGRKIRSAPVPTGTVQNTYLFFDIDDYGRLALSGENIALELGCFCEVEGRALLEIRDASRDELSFVPLGCIGFPKGWSRLKFPIETTMVGANLSRYYHTYHCELLGIISKGVSSGVISSAAGRFESYLNALEKAG